MKGKKTMTRRVLVIGNKNYSSWSLRPWLAMSVLGIPFEEVLIPLDEADTKEKIREFSLAGRVPVLIEDDLTVWESLAILERLAESAPDAGIWPADPEARAEARAISAEMHAGFGALRDYYPMNTRRRVTDRLPTPAVAADIARVTEIWRTCIEASGGPFLFGAFSAADAMYAPVVSRFETYQVEVDDTCRSYMDDMLTLPAFEAWYRAGEAETWVVEADEV